jgi:hypothetical protein
MTGSDGHTVFVQLIGGRHGGHTQRQDCNTISKQNKILLFPAPAGESFQVLATCLGVTAAQTVTLPLLNGCLQNFFWNYQNNGLTLFQLRFYPA